MPNAIDRKLQQMYKFAWYGTSQQPASVEILAIFADAGITMGTLLTPVNLSSGQWLWVVHY